MRHTKESKKSQGQDVDTRQKGQLRVTESKLHAEKRKHWGKREGCSDKDPGVQQNGGGDDQFPCQTPIQRVLWIA